MAMSEQETTWAPKPEDIPRLMAEAEAGNAVSQYNLGLCYANGNGVEVDLAEAVRWLRKAAERGNVLAQCNLGWCYAEGVGVGKDMAEAVNTAREQAEEGDIVSLTPACASFDMYRMFEDRGRHFKQLVNELV